MSKLPIPKNTLVQHVLILGKTRSGKSSKMRLIVEYFLDRGIPVCLIDPKGDWWGLKSSADGKKAGYPIIIFGSEWAKFADVRINKHSGAEIGRLVATGNRPCIIDMKGMTVGDRTQFFIDFADAYFRHAEGKRVLAIDECHNFAPKGKIFDPQAGMALHWANRLASEGGGMGITLVSASQRPQKVHNDYLSSHETLIACRAFQKHDRDAFKDWIDACGDPEAGKQLLATLAEMKREEAWVYSPEAGFGPKRITFPMFQTYDSFAPQEAKKSRRLKGWAAVNLKEIESKIVKLVEENKAKDPKELQKRVLERDREIERLKTDLAKKPAGKAAPALDKKTLDQAEKRGFERAKKEATVAAKELIVKTVAAIEKEIDPLAETMRAAVHSFRSKTADRLKGLVRERQALVPVYKPAPAVPAGSASVVPKVPSRAKSVPRIDAAPPIAPDGSALTKPQLALLRALAWWRAMGHDAPSSRQIAAIAGWKPGGSNIKDRLGELKKRGLVDYADKEAVSLTEAGIAAAPAPDMTASIVDGVRAVLTGPQQTLFDALLAAPRGPVERDALAEAVGWQPGGSNIKDRLGELKSMEIVDYSKGGPVELREWVVEGERLAA